MHFKLIRGRQPPARVQQDVVELEGQGQVRMRRAGRTETAGAQSRFSEPPQQLPGLGRSSLSSAGCSSLLPGGPGSARGPDQRPSALTRKNMRCWSPLPESLLRLPRRMNSCGRNRPRGSAGSTHTCVHTETVAASCQGPRPGANYSGRGYSLLNAVLSFPGAHEAGTTVSSTRRESSAQRPPCEPGTLPLIPRPRISSCEGRGQRPQSGSRGLGR